MIEFTKVANNVRVGRSVKPISRRSESTADKEACGHSF